MSSKLEDFWSGATTSAGRQVSAVVDAHATVKYRVRPTAATSGPTL